MLSIKINQEITKDDTIITIYYTKKKCIKIQPKITEIKDNSVTFSELKIKGTNIDVEKYLKDYYITMDYLETFTQKILINDTEINSLSIVRNGLETNITTKQ